MVRRIRWIWIVSLSAMIGLSLACGSVSPRQPALESTVAALQSQVAASAVVVPTATSVTVPDWREQLTGLTYPPMPEGWESTGGALTFSTCPANAFCSEGDETYAVAYWRQTGQTAMGTAEELLLFEKEVGYALNGEPIWTVLDVLVGSEVGGSNWLTQSCRLGDSSETDNEIVALSGILQDPSSPAWRANHLTGHFEPISPQGLICEDETAVD